MNERLDRAPSLDTSRFGFGPGWWTPVRVLLFTALVVACALTRFIDLGAKPIMHDESLFVYYTEYQIHRELTYLYMPILHGPLHLWVQAIVFTIFGTSDYTLRLGMAILGFGGFFWVWGMRRWLGPVGSFVSLAFYVFSPSVMYYNRFFREDGVYLFVTLWIVGSMAHWWHSRRPGWLASLVLATVALFLNKESSLFLYFAMATFVMLLAVHDSAAWLLRGTDREALPERGTFPPFPHVAILTLAIFGAGVLLLTRLFEGISYEASVVSVLGHDFVLRDVRSIPKALGWHGDVQGIGVVGEARFWRILYVVGFAAALATALKLKLIIDNRFGYRAFLTSVWRSVWVARFWFLGALALGFALYLFLFTTAFEHPKGPFQLYHETLEYWMGQNAIHRIKGPFHMHLVNMLVYELPPVIFVLVAWTIGVLRINWSRTTPVGLVLACVALAVFHVAFFRHIQYPMPYFRALTLLGLAVAFGLIVRPALGRVLFPGAVAIFLVWSLAYFNGDGWAAFLDRPYAKEVAAAVDAAKDAAPVYEQVKFSGRQFLDDTLSLDRGVHLFIIAFLVIVGTVLTWHCIDKDERYHGWLIWWLITMIGAASYAREKMPQVGIHIAVPMILLMGVYAQKLVTRPAWRRWRVLAVAALSLSLLWQAKAAFALCFKNVGDVRERLVYGDTTRDLTAHVDLIRRYQRVASVRSGTATQRVFPREEAYNPPEWMEWYNDPTHRKDLKVLVKQAEVVWPLRWYLRDIEWTEWVEIDRAIDERYPFIFCNVGDEDRYPRLRDEYHIYRGRARMHWTPPPVSWSNLIGVWTNTVPDHYLLNSGQNTLATDSKAEWKKLWRYWWNRDVYEASRATYTSLATVEYLFCARKDLGPY